MEIAIQCLLLVGFYVIIQSCYYNATKEMPKWFVIVDIVFQVMVILILLGGIQWSF